MTVSASVKCDVCQCLIAETPIEDTCLPGKEDKSHHYVPVPPSYRDGSAYILMKASSSVAWKRGPIYDVCPVCCSLLLE